MINIGKYSICILDLVTNSNGRLSSTKIWLHIANLVMSKTMLNQLNVGWELLAAYGSVVGGSYVATVFLNRRYPDATVDVPDDKPKDSPIRGRRITRGIRATQHGDDMGGGE